MHPKMNVPRAIVSAASASLVLLAVAACADSSVAPRTTREAGISASNSATDASSTGAVYTTTNAPDGNTIVAFSRGADGALTPIGSFATGGLGVGGTVDPLVSQYSIVLSADHSALFVVNAGSDQLSSFRVNENGSLVLAGIVRSGGARPISLAVHGDLLYALNTNDNSVSGFRVTGGARLVALPHSTHALASGASGAAAVRFTPDGRFLIVTERVSNRLEVFEVQPNGRLGDPVVTAAHGGATFGFDITSHNQPIVSETQGSVTSYALAADASLNPISASVATGGAATCWVILTSDGRFAYATNAGSGFVSGFAVDANGELTPLTPGSATGNDGAGSSPIDLDQVGGRLLYTLEAGTGTIGRFAIAPDGTLTAGADTPAGAPASGLQGLAAY